MSILDDGKFRILDFPLLELFSGFWVFNGIMYRVVAVSASPGLRRLARKHS